MARKSSIRVMVVEQNVALRDGLLAIIREDPGLEVVCAPVDPEEAFREFLRLRPEVSIIDSDMPDSLMLMRRIRFEDAGAVMIGLVNYEWDDVARAVVGIAGSPCLAKDRIRERLSIMIRQCGLDER